MKLWVDDFRDAPDSSWTEARKCEQAIRLLAHNFWQEISLDHDIENRPDDETFKSVAYFIGAQSYMVEGYKPKITIHSDNPVGAKELQLILSDFGIHGVPWEPFTSDKDFKTKYGLT